MHEVVIEKLVQGGQGLGTLSDGKKIFVWNALPGETVEVELKKSKRGHAEGIATKIIKPSKERETPKDQAYLSTSPWQMMSYLAENTYKQEILAETLEREHVQYSGPILFQAPSAQWHYRNKMEYSFWADDDGLHLALFNRGTHGKIIVSGSSIARQVIDEVAGKIVATLNKNGVRGSQLKTLIVRSDQKNNVVAALFVKDETFNEISELSTICQGLAVYYSNPKSPASVITKSLYEYGNLEMSDTVSGIDIRYNVDSFFQVNLPIFEEALQAIAAEVKGIKNIVDMYSGVGTIGLAVGATKLIEIDSGNASMAKQNVSGKKVAVILASSELATEHVTKDNCVIFDPPRAGLHKNVIERVREVVPKKIIYLSCNPITQARDVALLQDLYHITSITGYNFFPRTPHIESLAILESK